MIKKALFALAISGLMASAQAGVLIDEGFDDVSGLAGKGWVLNNASTPGGSTPGWYQGDQNIFEARTGAPQSYAAANYNNAGAGGDINNWLITPEFSTALGGTISFWLRSETAQYIDQFAFGLSDGSSDLASFTLGEAINAVGAWTQYSFDFDAVDGIARFAIQYTGGQEFANYIGVDDLIITDAASGEVPEPASILILAAGAAGMAAARRRKRVA